MKSKTLKESFRRCLECKSKFIPFTNSQVVCTALCGSAYARKQREKKEVKDWKDKKKDLTEKLKTHSDYVQELQKIFNEFIRLRDALLPCISCGTFEGKMNACHYRSAGGNPELRFNELNCHKGCERCNSFLSGNLIDYRIGLIKKIGVANVEFLEGKHEPQKLSIPALIELKVKYRYKIKQLQKQ